MRASALTATAAAGTALALFLSGCGSDSKTAPSSSSSSKTSSSSKSSTSKATSTPTASAGGQTIAEYLNASGVSSTVTKPTEDGAPNVELPFPEGWEKKSDDLPDGAYGGIEYTGPDADTALRPTIFSYLWKLVGNVDVDAFFKHAPNELLGLDGYEPVGEGGPGELGGFQAYQLAGTYSQDGTPAFIAQKTVLIPGQDAMYMLQLNAYSTPAQQDVAIAAINDIDANTKIE